MRYAGRPGKVYFCSRTCFYISRVGRPHTGKTRPIQNLHLVSCSYCQIPVKAWRYQLRLSKNIFCSRKCFGKFNSIHKIAEKSCNWKGGYYSTIANTLCNSRYRRIREIVLVLDNSQCQLCSSSMKLEVHHIVEKGKNQALIFDINNMITLCKKCHCSIYGREEAYYGIFGDIVANRMNSGNPELVREGNPEPSVQSTKVQRLLEHSDMLNDQDSASDTKVMI